MECSHNVYLIMMVLSYYEDIKMPIMECVLVGIFICNEQDLFKKVIYIKKLI